MCNKCDLLRFWPSSTEQSIIFLCISYNPRASLGQTRPNPYSCINTYDSLPSVYILVCMSPFFLVGHPGLTSRACHSWPLVLSAPRFPLAPNSADLTSVSVDTRVITKYLEDSCGSLSRFAILLSLIRCRELKLTC